MKAELAILFILSLFLLSVATSTKGSIEKINLAVNVQANINSYFDGKDVITKTNDSQPVVVTKEKIQSSERSGYVYTITPGL